ncbi:MAG: hypothetical protein ACFCU9_11685 [Cyanophyceae cyanobacterium]
MNPTETFRDYVRRRYQHQQRWRSGQSWIQQGSALVAGMTMTVAGVLSLGLEEKESWERWGWAGMTPGLVLTGLLALGWGLASLSLGLATVADHRVESSRRQGVGSWQLDLHLLWQDYIQDLRLTWLDPQYGRLEIARQMLVQCVQLCDDLWLESVEARYWLSTLPVPVSVPVSAGEEMQLLSQLSQELPGYVGHLQQQHQRLMALVPQLQGGIDQFEAVLISIERELEGYFETSPALLDVSRDPALEQLREMDLVPVVALSQDLVRANGSLQGVTQEMEHLFNQILAPIAS